MFMDSITGSPNHKVWSPKTKFGLQTSFFRAFGHGGARKGRGLVPTTPDSGMQLNV